MCVCVSFLKTSIDQLMFSVQFQSGVAIQSPLTGGDTGRFGMTVSNIGDIDLDGYEGNLLTSISHSVCSNEYCTVYA